MTNNLKQPRKYVMCFLCINLIPPVNGGDDVCLLDQDTYSNKECNLFEGIHEGQDVIEETQM